LFTNIDGFGHGIGTRRGYRVIKAQSQSDVPKEQVVIVGAGIAGLATALSLHRLQFQHSS